MGGVLFAAVPGWRSGGVHAAGAIATIASYAEIY
jgi:hypothetical protein